MYCITAGNLINNYVLSFVADEIPHKTYFSGRSKNLELYWGRQYEMNLDFEQQFLYGLRVLFAGLLVG